MLMYLWQSHVHPQLQTIHMYTTKIQGQIKTTEGKFLFGEYLSDLINTHQKEVYLESTLL